MIKIILNENQNEVNFSDIDDRYPVFAKRDGKLVGMMVKEDEGWILRTGKNLGANGHHNTLRECMESCIKYNYEFYIA